MKREIGFWLPVLVSILMLVVTVYVPYDIHSRGPIPEKKLELRELAPVDPMKDLSVLGDKASLLIHMQNQTVDNIMIVNAWIKNVGKDPILPSDYYENISVNVEKPWKILAVRNTGESFYVALKWNRISDIRFEAAPSLLNPGDLTSINVYLTNTQFDKEVALPHKPELNVEWKTRIVNMKHFTAPPDMFNMATNVMWAKVLPVWMMPFSGALPGWALPFTIVVTMLLMALYLYMLSKVGFLRKMSLISIVFVIAVSFLSFTAAESMATYLFGNGLTKVLGVNWMNTLWIILNAVLLVVLGLKAKPMQANDSEK